MNKHTVKIAIAAFGLISAGVANAAAGAYLQAQAGIGGMDTKNYSTSNTNNPYNSVSLRNGVAGRLSIGYLLSNNNLDYGAELGYSQYPTNTYKSTGTAPVLTSGPFPLTANTNTTQTYRGNNVDLLGVAKYNFLSNGDSGFYVVGKAGVARVSQQYKDTTTADILPTTTTTSNKNALKPEVALGGGYNFNQNVSVDLTADHISGAKTNPLSSASPSKIAAVNTLMLGVSYHFS